MRRRNQHGDFYKDPCLTMHQPWASLLVYGIKRIEGRSWPAPIRGRLWIHAASKVPDVATIKAMEEFYREIYAVDGVTDLKFPEHYPVSKLIGCVEIAGCLRREELASWKAVPKGARLEALTDFCWLCEQPQKLIDPLKMRGDQGVYNLEWKVAEAAVISLLPVESPYSIKFPLPNPANLYSLRPGSLPKDLSENNVLGAAMSPSLIAAIDGARAAAT
ncbi:activating signal cointegrator 1-like [Chenopodium quinoa]|uniref:activating signal cointegrator 1-like n=1 Tax=Chenopodium quinoa TaxID=63459 RepID=UPI000B7755FF|nr:activating signal cointegrator 1-like [Chenopodium quinoa]